MIRAEAPLETIPLFVRGGAILPTGPDMIYVGEKTGPLRFDIFADRSGAAAAHLYEDDGISPVYRQGLFRRTEVTWRQTETDAAIRLNVVNGSYHPPARDFVFTIPSAPSVTDVLLDGRQLPAASLTSEQTGWAESGDVLTIRLPDDGLSHQIQITGRSGGKTLKWRDH